jgi:hypothetical protein
VEMSSSVPRPSYTVFGSWSSFLTSSFVLSVRYIPLGEQLFACFLGSYFKRLTSSLWVLQLFIARICKIPSVRNHGGI